MSQKIAARSSLIYFRDFISCKKCPSQARLENKTVIITGGNAGIGKETSLELAKRGARIIIACRDTKKGEETASEILKKVTTAEILVKELDLASFSSIRSFCNQLLQTEPQINVLINNAGVACCPKSSTEDGFEMQFGVNHLGHFLLTNLLLDRLKVSAPSRIITVSSIAHVFGKIDFDDINLERSYNPLQAYCRSKLANILFTRELAKRLEGTGVTCYSLHPGAVHTGLGRHMNASIHKSVGYIYEGCSRILWKNACKGAQTTIYCAVDESLANESGQYYCDCTLIQPSIKAQNDVLAKHLWNSSASFCF